MTATTTIISAALDVVLGDTPQPSYRAEGGLSMSAVGGCRRRGSYLWNHTEQGHPPREGRAAEIGTALHAQVLPGVARLLNGRAEVETSLEVDGITVPGTVDLWLQDVVADLKTVNPRAFQLLTQPRASWVMQVTAGALALEATTCVVIALDRDTGASRFFQWRTEEHADAVRQWIRDACRPLDDVARDRRGPGIDTECDWCPFQLDCWPEQPPPAVPQALLVHDDEEAERMLDLYLTARTTKTEAEATMEFAKACLTGTESGIYGPWRLSWVDRAGRERLDEAEARRILDEAGLPIPVVRGPMTRSIGVRAAK